MTKQPYRILMIAPTSFFSDYGGHIRILEETRNLQALGHQVTIVTYYKGSDLPGLDIRRTAPLPWRTNYEVGSSRHKIAFDIYLMVQALIEAWRLRPHIIHGHMHEGALIGSVLAKLLHIPLVFDFQGSLTAEMVDHQFLNPNGRIFALVKRLEQMINRQSHAILTSSLQAQTLLKREFNVPASHLHPLPDCADIERFSPQHFTTEAKQALRHHLQIPDDHIVVTYLGLLTDYQGIPHLIETAAHLKQAHVTADGRPVHFLIMGYPNVAHYRQMAQQWEVADRVTFTGKVEYRDAPYYLSLGEISVAPKMSASEGSGKVLNYMAMAQPVVAYDTPVHREYLSELGVYASAGDVGDFTAALTTLLNNPQRCQQLGQRLRQRAISQYSWRRACERIVAVYDQLQAQLTPVPPSAVDSMRE